MPTPQLEFSDVKTAATAEQVIKFLALKMVPKTIEKTQEDGTVTSDISWRGDCPFCKCSRSFVISTNKKLFNCFKCKPSPQEQKTGGDMLKLVSKLKGLGWREAALELGKFCGVEKRPETPAQTAEVKNFDVERYLQNLDPEHEALRPLGISPETLEAWKAGYVSNYQGKGARLAVAIQGTQGIVGFMGIALDPENPELSFPKHIDPKLYVFGYGMSSGPELYLAAHPLDVLRAWDNGFPHSVCFLNPDIESVQFQWLVRLMDDSRVRSISIA